TTSYVVFVLGIVHLAFLPALVLLGIAELFLSMPLRFQPAVTGLFIHLGTAYIYYGPHPSRLSEASLSVFSSIVVLLACVPLYNALRSSGPKVLAALLLSPLFMASLVQLIDVGRYGPGFLNSNPRDAYYPFYFNADLLVRGFRFPLFRFIVAAAQGS